MVAMAFHDGSFCKEGYHPRPQGRATALRGYELVHPRRNVEDVRARTQPGVAGGRQVGDSLRILVLPLPKRKGEGFLHHCRGRGRVHNMFDEHVVPLHRQAILVDIVGGVPDLQSNTARCTVVLVLRAVTVLINAIQNERNRVDG